MGRVTVSVGGRDYPLSCADGEELHLSALGNHLSEKATELSAAIGTMSESRLLLMAGLQIADELFTVRSGAATTSDDERYAAILARVEALADTLEAAVG